MTPWNAWLWLQEKNLTETLRGIIYCSGTLRSTAANAVAAISAPNQHTWVAMHCHGI